YEVLAAIRREDLPTLVIVVSGDIQPEAHKRVMKLGALDFIEKPVDTEKVAGILDRYGIFKRASAPEETGGPRKISEDGEATPLECYQEVANVAMGRAADLLARLLGIFVVMPVPRVKVLKRDELLADLNQTFEGRDVAVICQGFIGAGIAGEALLVFHDTRIGDIARLLHHRGEIDDAAESELLMDIASILIGACLKGLAEQLDVGFSQGLPVVMGKDVKLDALLKDAPMNWESIMMTDMGCRIEEHEIHCHLILLFTEDSIEALNSFISFMTAE
ncbi:MAG TPA: response regulator, partial [Chromatiales bacterium]|nr:response regulator [Chromatiales bacterium]